MVVVRSHLTSLGLESLLNRTDRAAERNVDALNWMTMSVFVVSVVVAVDIVIVAVVKRLLLLLAICLIFLKTKIIFNTFLLENKIILNE